MSRRIKVDPDKKSKITKAGLRSTLSIFKYIKPYLGYFVGGMLFLVLGSLIFMIFPGAAGEMANLATGQDKYDLGLKVSDFWWVFLLILASQGLLSYFRTVFFAIVSEKGMADLRKDLYNKIISQNMHFFEERRVGELTSRVTTDVEQLQSAFSISLAEFIRQIVTIIAGIFIIAYVAPRLSLVMLATFPIIVLAAVFFGRYIKKLSKRRQDKLAETNTIVEETFQSFSIVKAFANEWYESIRYSKSIDEVVNVSLKFAKVRGVFFIFIITILFGGIFFILWRGALMVEAGVMEVGDLFSFIIYTGIIGGAIASIGTLYAAIAQAIGATERIQEILQSETEVQFAQSGEVEDIRLKGDIEFKDVRFTYPTRTEMEILKGINIKVNSGEKIALVGQSGSGKSTIVQLLMGFYEIDGGSLQIDGKSIEHYDLLSLRNKMAIVPQEVILFGGTIEENVRYGNPDASHEEIMDAIRKSNSLEFIEKFPEGIHTIVGDRGIKLSGGQRQRIAIARAILRNPKILILDEATSSLDTGSEKIVQDALDRLMEGRTSIIIAHRLATIKNVDRIYVLDDGHIVEEGDHNALSNDVNGVYYNLAKLQFEMK